MMHSTNLHFTYFLTYLLFTAAANRIASGMFFVRVSSAPTIFLFVVFDHVYVWLHAVH